MYLNRVAEELLGDILASDKVGIVLGARQVGKTTLVEHVLKGHRQRSILPAHQAGQTPQQFGEADERNEGRRPARIGGSGAGHLSSGASHLGSGLARKFT
jgi:hypothetical protein